MNRKIKLRRMKDWSKKEKMELKEYFNKEIYKAHLDDTWWSDKILEMEEKYQNEK